MIKLEKTKVYGFEEAVRGMRNPMNSWAKSDSMWSFGVDIGENDWRLMTNLAKAGSVHAKYRRMITVYVDITAPLYWWKEFDTYKIGTVANSCSTMHKIHSKEITLDDFSHERLMITERNLLSQLIDVLNYNRMMYNKHNNKDYWEQIIQLLPSSYNQKRTIMFNYEVLVGMYRDRKAHKLNEWVEFCKWIETLPYSQLITG